jgi:arylsulfatase A-like enzyme
MRLRRYATIATALAILGGIGWGCSLSTAPTTATPKNIVLIVACTFRADQLGVYGSDVEPMPFLAERAARGTVFERNISAAPWTKPAVTALFTGRYASSMGMVSRSDGLDRTVLPEAIDTLGERMRATGRRTVGATANPNASDRFGFAQGFDAYLAPQALWHDGEFQKIDGQTLVEQALSAVAEAPEKPFYLQILLVDAHLPYQLGPADDAFRQPGVSKRLAQYRAMLRYLDDRIRRVVDGLAVMGHDESDTVFVVVGDHGEGLNLPDHHGNGHGFFLYPSTVRVPLIVWGGGLPQGRRVAALTTSIDVAPTLSTLAGAPIDSADGVEQTELWTGAAQRSTRTTAFAETYFKGAERAAAFTEDVACQRVYEAATPDRAKAKPPFPDGCYRWRTDPDALDRHTDAALTAELDAWHARQAASIERRQQPATAIDEGTRSALEGLGYVE